jgi:hypothetical protein
VSDLKERFLDWLTRLSFRFIRRRLGSDEAWAWSWHCAVAMYCIDRGCSHQQGNEIAATFMRGTWKVDTSKFEFYRAFEKAWAVQRG